MTVTAADVALWGKLPVTPTGDEAALLERVIAAVTGHVSDYYVVDEVPTDAQELAIIMQSWRLWNRRDTPEGVAAFADIAAVRITGLDPDVERLLTRKWGFG